MIKITLSIFLLTVSMASLSLELKVGVISKGRDTVRNDEQKIVSPIIKSVIKSDSSEGVKRSFGYTNLGEGNDWYRFNKDLVIEAVNVETKQYLGSWPLTRWPHFSRMSEVQQRIDGNELNRDALQVNSPGLGCLAQSPLRYGDIEDDGQSELVLFLYNDFVVFSLSQQKTVFSIGLSVNDWESLQSTREYHHDEVAGYQDYPNDPQYDSSLAHAHGGSIHIAGYRGYSKLYTGDFDNNGKADILVWRKLYESKLENDPLRGFNFIRSEWLHFEKIVSAETAGEYIPQESSSETAIQGWLTAKKQNWQSGFPSKSECAGQEGQLIPEMHDPLLNDPDVLK